VAQGLTPPAGCRFGETSPPGRRILAAMAPRPDESPPVVPDDASALEPDRLAWQAEERVKRRRERARRLLFTRRWDRFGLSGPLVCLCLLGVSLVAGLAVVFVPRPDPPAGPAPLSAAPELTVPAESTGYPHELDESTRDPAPGHRLPRTDLVAENETVAAASLRPAVVALVPDRCACAPSLRAVLRQAQGFRLRLWLIATGEEAAARRQLVRLDESIGSGAARWAVDPPGRLARAVLARGLTLVLVRADGVVSTVRRAVGTDGRVPSLELPMARLGTRPGRPGPG
jgi:hypothetical protein